jgi:hypothetical protein
MLKVGAAKSVLTYPEGFFPHISFRGRYFTGVHDELHVRAIVIETDATKALLISIELGDVGDDWIPFISKATNIPEDNIFLAATHTHAAPHAGGSWKEDVKDSSAGKVFSTLCLNSVLSASKQAIGNMQDAFAAFGVGACDVNINRDYKDEEQYIQASNPEGPSDKTVSVLKFMDKNGKIIASVINYAVHSNVTFYQTWEYEKDGGMLVSSDLSGCAMNYLEESNNGISLFFMSAAADQSPRYLANHRAFAKRGNTGWVYYGRDAGFALMDAQGCDLGEAAKHTLQNAKSIEVNSITAKSRIVRLTLQKGKEEGEISKGANSYASQYRENSAGDRR